ncbi:Protein transport protein sec20 [Schizosaccharomyces pombe]|uniref:Protein transport protein sec20 n=1 Tax=Schizosaccharomyces pombe (strain 972 / ATCC 24843) TaxID=284812 RepID=SEC20_SCHPO|nr:putative SNARE protein Sec20 [Schizosaccharomyces pombe]O42852.1 RecName: Full=Protein transport protein sec20 [Schizosaccharomyces pombe 972h-]CAA16989.1 SNARE Sec20 (predicted) [Schizosaccharomyces pombe]|eukprot:NP_594444.1 putative SNARE protein Sec20 [Schizosaccharomyces pombe]
MADVLNALEEKVVELQQSESVEVIKRHFREFRKIWETARVELEYSSIQLDSVLRYEKAVQEYIRLNRRYRNKIASGEPWLPIAQEIGKIVDEEEITSPSDGSLQKRSMDNSGSWQSDDIYLTSASQVTAAMRDIHAQMVQAVDMSAENAMELSSSTNLLETLQEKYFGVEDVLYTSKRIIKSLKLSDRSDYFLVVSGFGFFIFVVVYLLFKRIVWPILSMFLWFLR